MKYLAVLCLILPGCAWLAGARPAVSLDSDRRLVADARARVDLVQQAADGAGLTTTATVLDGAAASLRTIQAGPIGEASIPSWPAQVVDAVHDEQAGRVRLVQDPALADALARTEAERARLEGESRKAHGQLQSALADAAGKWGLGTVATGGGGLLVGLLGLAWRNRKKAQAVYALVRSLQDVKHQAEAGQEIDVPATIQHHAGANGARAEIEKTYRRHKVGVDPARPSRARKAAEAVVRTTAAGVKKAKSAGANALARLRKPTRKKPKSKD